MSKEFEDLKTRHELTRVAENTKMVVVCVLVASVAAFHFMGKENVKQVIWYWAGFMTLMLLICVAQDIVNKVKMKRLGL